MSNLQKLIFYTKYSRLLSNGNKETYWDVVNRVVDSLVRYRKIYSPKEDISKEFINNMKTSMYNFQWLPSGRILYNAGSKLIDRDGGLALSNCAFISVERDSFAKDISLIMEFIMNGLGCGVGINNKKVNVSDFYQKYKSINNYGTFIIDDSRAGWCDSIYLLLSRPNIQFDYSKLRPAGSLLKTAGGISTGPESLKSLHEKIRKMIDDNRTGKTKHSYTKFVADIANSIAQLIMAGTRRSAEMLISYDPKDTEFNNLKTPGNGRDDIMCYSNNTICLNSKSDFLQIPEFTKSIQLNGEPGLLNFKNIKYGRLKELNNDIIYDEAIGLNPCGEIPLESGGICCLSNTYPSNCTSITQWYKACEYATFCASTVALIPTGIPKTDEIMKRTRRIGVSLSGYASWSDTTDTTQIIKSLRNAYNIIKTYNKQLSIKAKVNASNRVTCVKPDGTTSLLAGVTPGIHRPYSIHCIRRIGFNKTDPICKDLIKSEIPLIDTGDQYVFSFKQKYTGCKRVLSDVSLAEQFLDAITLQDHFVDNAVSFTGVFSKQEQSRLSNIISQGIPFLKCMSIFPYPEIKKNNIYKYLPIEPITKEKYESIKENNISFKSKKDSTDSKYCTNDTCNL